jgi:hypothetical protein
MSQTQFNYTADALKEIENCLSSDRFSTYILLANGNKEEAVKFYLKNMRLSEILFSTIHIVEVVLRNMIHNCFKAKWGESWYQIEKSIVQGKEQIVLKETINQFNTKDVLKSGDIIAALRFGFWTALFGRKYEETWRHYLRHIFKTNDKPLMRKQILALLQDLRKLRNRIAHHECLLKMDLIQHYEDSLQLIQLLSPVMALWIRQHKPFEENLFKEQPL